MKRQDYIQKIIKLLSYLKAQVEVSSSLNLTDINICSENFYRDFLNLLYGYKLENQNTALPNAPAIDLVDIKNKISIQVTSTSSLQKVKKTVETFIKLELYKTYDRLIILNIVKKSSHKSDFEGEPEKFQLNTKTDIWDIGDLTQKINDLQIPRIQEIFEFLKREIKIEAQETVDKEVSTFMSLIEILSDESQPFVAEGFIEKPDPHKKIDERFATYSEYLKNQYVELYEEYGYILKDVEKTQDISSPRIRRLGLQLKNFSDQKLLECQGNPQQALMTLVTHYKNLLSKHNRVYNETAIRFYLVDQIIRCNVFPNKELISG